MLVSRTIAHVNAHHHHRTAATAANPTDLSADLAGASVLLDALAQLGALLDAETHASGGAEGRLRLLPARGLVRSALVLALDAHSCPDQLAGSPTQVHDGRAKTAAELALQTRCVDGLAVATKETLCLGAEMRALREGIGGGMDVDGSEGSDSVETAGSAAVRRCVGPLMLDGLYCALATLHWQFREVGDEEAGRGVEDVKLTLTWLAGQWGLAREYLSIENQYQDMGGLRAVFARSVASRRS
jgi:hypothetical protein